MILGIVSNCWKVQLDNGTDIDGLVEEAQRRGYKHVELRQGCLGEYESKEENVPNAAALAQLREKFPAMGFNIAIALPFMRGGLTPDNEMFAAGLEAAAALNPERPHLRIVDPFTEEVPPFESVSASLAELGWACVARKGLLSVENARQPWNALREVFALARERMREAATQLKFCYDPCNLLNAPDKPNPQEVTQQMLSANLAMFHFKQSKDGQMLLTVTDGDVDWNAQIAALQRKGYRGPALFEIPPHKDVWKNLQESRDYINGMVNG
jgi:sugar phosphate isomerase/epimerase